MKITTSPGSSRACDGVGSEIPFRPGFASYVDSSYVGRMRPSFPKLSRSGRVNDRRGTLNDG